MDDLALCFTRLLWRFLLMGIVIGANCGVGLGVDEHPGAELSRKRASKFTKSGCHVMSNVRYRRMARSNAAALAMVQENPVAGQGRLAEFATNV
jgi:hypothetical protein